MARVEVCGAALFMMAGCYAVIGNLIVCALMKSRGGRLPSSLGGLSVVLYFFAGPGVRSRGIDWFAVSVLCSCVLAAVSGYLLFCNEQAW